MVLELPVSFNGKVGGDLTAVHKCTREEEGLFTIKRNTEKEQTGAR